jgi:hypothetical protein
MNLRSIENCTLAERILDSLPNGAYAMSALLRLLDIIPSDAVPTAAVECRLQPRMLINLTFLEKSAETPEKLLMLVMHELHHVLLGHTTLFPRATRVQNFVFDAVINGLLCRMFPLPEHTAFFTDFYRVDRFPECLLRPLSAGRSNQSRLRKRSRRCQKDGANRWWSCIALYTPKPAQATRRSWRSCPSC